MIRGERMTAFQVQCEKKLADALAAIGKSISDRRLAGNAETYVQGNVGADLTFWIYEDGADFKTSLSNQIFEKPDFNDLEDLSKQFVSKILEQLT